MKIPRSLQVAALILISFIVFTTSSWAAGARKVVVKTTPTYPTLARDMNIQGVVKLEAEVLPNGLVKSVEVKGGHPLLTRSAVTAVEHWKFEPASYETIEKIQVDFFPQ